MRLFLIISIFNLLTVESMSQLHVRGEIRHNGKGLDQSVIKVFEGDKLMRTVAATKKGHYEMDFPLGHEYLLLYYRPYMIPVYIKIDTRVSREWNANKKVVELPLNMDLHHRFIGLDVEAYRQPIGVIEQSGNGSNTFGFTSNKQILNDLKKINDESLARELSGEKPTDEETALKDVSNEDTELEDARDINPVTESLKSDENVATQSQRRVDDFSVTERALDAKSQSIKQQNNVQVSAISQREEEEKNYLSEQKKHRSQVAELQRNDEEARVQAIVKVHQKNDELLAKAAAERPTNMSKAGTAQIIPISKSIESGWFYDEELLKVNVSGRDQVYRKVVYDWVLFESTSYYAEDKEIAAQEYEEIRKLFN